MMDVTADAVVIGGGASGLSAAVELRARGHSVVVLESASALGGLARSIRVGGEPIERYYHHIFPQDRETRQLIDELQLSTRLEWLKASMAVMHEGRVYPFNSPIDLLRFEPLRMIDRLRLGAAVAAQVARRDRGRLDRLPVAREGPAWFGRRGFDLVWRPLLEAKFGQDAGSVPMAWLVARIRQRAAARKVGGDRLGYLRGSLGTLIEAYGQKAISDGVRVETDTRVRSLKQTGEGWLIETDSDAVHQLISARTVVACVSGSILLRLVALPDGYARSMEAIRYRGIVCALLELSERVSPYYWVNVTDRLGLGCVGIIEHTNFIPAERYGGRRLLYLAHYVDRDGPTWSASADELVDAVEPALRVLNPAFSRAWIHDIHVSRDPFAQPIPAVGGPMPGLPVETGLPGLFHASLAHIYPDDRGVSLAIGLGRRAAGATDAWLRSAIS